MQPVVCNKDMAVVFPLKDGDCEFWLEIVDSVDDITNPSRDHAYVDSKGLFYIYNGKEIQVINDHANLKIKWGNMIGDISNQLDLIEILNQFVKTISVNGTNIAKDNDKNIAIQVPITTIKLDGNTISPVDYIVNLDLASVYAKKTEIPKNVSELQNDAGYIKQEVVDQLVDQYVNAKLDTFADKADMNKFKDDVNANLSNQDKKIADLQNTTKVSLDSQNTKIDNFKSEVNTSLSNQNTSINQTTSTQNSKIATLESRMNTFTSLSAGSTTGDAELQDIRVGANGVTYSTAGDAVRGQYSQLKEDLDELVDLKVNLRNITKPEGYLLHNKKVNIPSGKYRFIFDILFSGENKTGTIYFRNSNGDDVKTKDIPNNKFVFDEEIEFSDNVSIINIWINSNATLNTFKMYDINSDVERLEGNISALETEITNVLYKDIKFPSQGYYIGNDGSIQGNANYGFTEKMPALPLTDYFFTTSCWVSEYDENKAFIKTTAELPINSKFTTQSNTKYIVISASKSEQNELVVAINYPYKSWEYNFDKITDIEKEIGSIGKAYTVGATNCDFTSVTACVKEAIKAYNSIVYIEQGEYDLIEEAKALYGEGFFDNMTSGYYGITLEHGIHLVISQNATLRYEYNGNNNYVLENVAMFCPGNGDFTIEGGTLIAKNSRYIIHDEKGSHTDRYTHKFERINMYCDNRNNPFGFKQCIGGGLGVNGDIVIKDCFFKSEFNGNETNKVAVSYHNTWGTVHGSAKSNIVFSGNYVEGLATVRFGYLGDYTTTTNCIVSNNSLGSEPILVKEVEEDGNTKLNMRLICFNNEIRN